MKKLLSAILVTLSLCAALSAYEWGGVLKNKTTVKTIDFSDAGVKQSDTLFLWYSAPIGKSGFKFSAEALYGIDYNKATGTLTQIVDVDLLKVYKVIQKEKFTASLNIGRFLFSDESKVIFSQNMDGVSAKFAFKKIAYKAAIGYTGLLNEKNVSILNPNSLAYGSNKQFYSLAYPFVVFDAGVTFNNLFAAQNLKLETMVFFDVGSAETNRYYFETILSGPIVKGWTYSAAFIAESLNFENFAFYASLNTFVSFGSNMYLKAGVEYASPKGDSAVTNFSTVTSRTICNSFTLHETTGIILPGVQFVYLGNDFYWGIDAKYLVDSDAGSYKGKGVEADFIFVYNIFTDLQLGLNVYSFIQTDSTSSANSNYGADLKVTFTF